MTLSIFTVSANLTSAESVAASRACAQTPWGGHMQGNRAAPCTFHLASRALLLAPRAAVCALRAVLPFVVLGRGLRPPAIAVWDMGQGSGEVDRVAAAVAVPVAVDHLAAAQSPAHRADTLRLLEGVLRSPRRQ
jgi:hypothetical protein